jgi:hypothetical protein
MSDAQYTLLQSILSNDILMTAILGAVGFLAATIAGWGVFAWRKYIKHQLTDAEAAMVERLADLAARWVEQTATPGTPDHERLHQAIAFVVAQAAARGITVDEEFITAAVEAAVLGLGHPIPVD